MSKQSHLASFNHESDATILIHHLSQLVHPHAQKIAGVSMVSVYGIARSPLFPLGQILTTDGAATLLRNTNTELILLLLRHQCLDCDHADAIDANDAALRAETRIQSVYELGTDKQALWISTTDDRRKTIAQLPSERRA